MRLIFIGPPGAGKGTQALRLAERTGLKALSSGDILRGEIRAGSEIGGKAAQYVESGTLVPDDVITQVMLAGLAKVPTEPGYILDGFPRTVPQAQALEEGLSRMGQEIDGVVDFSMEDTEIVRRIVNRRTCGSCGQTYNLLFLPPSTDGVCDKCGGALTQRADDREDVVKTRLETYRSQTAPLVEYYSEKGLLHTVDASAEADKVEVQLAQIFGSLGGHG
jgi:adenylate kinase